MLNCMHHACELTYTAYRPIYRLDEFDSIVYLTDTKFVCVSCSYIFTYVYVYVLYIHVAREACSNAGCTHAYVHTYSMHVQCIANGNLHDDCMLSLRILYMVELEMHTACMTVYIICRTCIRRIVSARMHAALLVQTIGLQ